MSPRLRSLSGAVMVLLVTGSALHAQGDGETARGADRFEPLDWLIGEWQGYGLFSDDTTYVHKRYTYEVGGMYLVERTIDMFTPAEPTTEYQIHQDITYFYRDGEAFRAKGFFVEGFIWNSRVGISGDSITVATDRVENGPPGVRARLTMVRVAPDRYEATFELAGRDGPFRVLERLVMRRIR